VLAGRVAFQYNGQVAEDSRLNINQPSLYAHVKLENWRGQGMSLSSTGGSTMTQAVLISATAIPRIPVRSV